MKELFKNWGLWARYQLPNQTTIGKINHLIKETKELKASAEQGYVDIVEIADCFGLLFSICNIEGIGYDDMCNALENKLEVNKAREWPEVSSLDGTYHHIVR